MRTWCTAHLTCAHEQKGMKSRPYISCPWKSRCFSALRRSVLVGRSMKCCPCILPGEWRSCEVRDALNALASRCCRPQISPTNQSVSNVLIALTPLSLALAVVAAATRVAGIFGACVSWLPRTRPLILSLWCCKLSGLPTHVAFADMQFLPAWCSTLSRLHLAHYP